MADLTSRGLIVAKGVLFFLLVGLSGALLILASPDLRTILLVAVLVWSSARLYYFLFYVLERYVDPSLRYSGLLALIRAIRSGGARKRTPQDSS
jgi:predicted Kef-type K+ transport protein